MSEIDKTESGKIQFEEFLKIMIDNLRPCDTDKQEDYERIFQYFVDEEVLLLLSICFVFSSHNNDMVTVCHWRTPESSKDLSKSYGIPNYLSSEKK